MKSLIFLLFPVIGFAQQQFPKEAFDSLSTITYKVQVRSSNMMDEELFKGLCNIFECEIEKRTIEGRDFFRYLLIPKEKTKQSANECLETSKEIYPDAFIVKFHNHKRIN